MIRGIIFIILVSIINIVLNILLNKVGNQSNNFLQAISNKLFWVAFTLGLFSLLALLGVYLSKFNLARGILFMGMISIIGGSLYGIIIQRNRLLISEYLILFLILILFVIRLFKSY